MYIHKSLLSQDCVASHREYLYLLIAAYAGGQQATHHHTSADWNSSVFVWRNPIRYLIYNGENVRSGHRRREMKQRGGRNEKK